MAKRDEYVDALVREREGYQRSPRKAHKVIGVDDELAARGFAVDDTGDLVELSKVTRKEPDAKKAAPRERAVTSKAPETAVPKD